MVCTSSFARSNDSNQGPYNVENQSMVFFRTQLRYIYTQALCVGHEYWKASMRIIVMIRHVTFYTNQFPDLADQFVADKTVIILLVTLVCMYSSSTLRLFNNNVCNNTNYYQNR